LTGLDFPGLGGKNSAGNGPDFARIAKLDREKWVSAFRRSHGGNAVCSEVAPPETIDRSVGQIISKARQDKEPKLVRQAAQLVLRKLIAWTDAERPCQQDQRDGHRRGVL
jgi:hypothetical protein